jgi:hypothetical protein
MSTRACIARKHGDGFLGVYHHWDGYPTGLGKTLWAAAHERPLPDLLRLLIDEHPAGWSTINGANLDLSPGFRELGDKVNFLDGERPAECYCHDDRHEEESSVTETDDMGMEWAYVFDEEIGAMNVLKRIGEDWTIRAVVPLDDPEPDWADMEVQA